MRIQPGEGPLVTRRNDDRITIVGKILRLAKLDELPQFINVFLGHMSIVGPRPEIPELVAVYNKEQAKLLSVKPGITSPATIYHRDEEEIVGTSDEILEYHKKVLIPKKASYDLSYVENSSLWFDVKIILLTLVSVVTNQSGYMREQTLKRRWLLISVVHILLSALAYYLSFLLRFDANIPHHEFFRFQKTIAIVVFFKMIFLGLFGLTHGYWRYVGVRDALNIAKAITGATICMVLAEYLFLDNAFPTGVILIDAILSFIFFTTLRFSTRFLREAYYPLAPKSSERLLIVGAADRGEALIRDILRQPDLACEIAGFVDLDSSKTGVKIHGFKVLGTLNSLEGILRESEITTIINTYSTLSRENTLLLSKTASKFKVNLKTLPSFSDVLAGRINMNRPRDLKYEDLLGRDEIVLDVELLNQVYEGKTVLVTGAGGSIGSELVRQIMAFNPKLVLLLDKDETLLYNIQSELKEISCAVEFTTLIGDIRNTQRLEMYFQKYRPNIVLHAAAYKHVPLLESHPHEAILNNIYGTRNVLQISAEYQVERFVIISTDKAVRPTNVMGASKALAERVLFEGIAPFSYMKCMAVRFGNVLGSRGSVIPLFRRQIGRGGPIKITHEEITRFFMSIPEASQLVLQAGAMGDGGEIFILKMGSPVKIKDLAYQMVEHAGLTPEVDITVEYTGLRPGEKMYEELLTDLENSKATEHEKIFVIHHTTDYKNAELNMESINSIEHNIYEFSNKEIRDFLMRYVPDYNPNNPVD